MPRTKKDLTAPVTITLPKSLIKCSKTVARVKGVSLSSWIGGLVRGYFQNAEKAIR